jgi:hypothetical protein
VAITGCGMAMAALPESGSGGRATPAERVARLLRHEVGDLLQTVYSTAAILGERLPAGLAMERRLVADLRARAELCKYELDAVVDLIAEPRRNPARIDLAPLVGAVVAHARRRYPSLPIPLDGDGGLVINADAQALAGTGTFLLLAMCQAARERVGVRLARAAGQATCTLERDGSPAGPAQLAWLSEPFATTQQAMFGLALALTRCTIEPCGGSLAVLPREGGGLRVQMSFPLLDA